MKEKHLMDGRVRASGQLANDSHVGCLSRETTDRHGVSGAGEDLTESHGAPNLLVKKGHKEISKSPLSDR